MEYLLMSKKRKKEDVLPAEKSLIGSIIPNTLRCGLFAP